MESSCATNKEEEKKPVVQSKHVTVKVKSQQDGSVLLFRIRTNSPLENLMKEYCNQMSLELKSIVFLFDEHVIKPLETADKLKMEEGDLIDATLHQYGGGRVI